MTIEPMTKKYIVCRKPMYNKAGKLTDIVDSFDTIKEALVFAARGSKADRESYEIFDRSMWRSLSRMAE